MSWKLRDYQYMDAVPLRALVIAGLREHFQDFKPELNPDLDDIHISYLDQGASILVAESLLGEIIGCGILMIEPYAENIARIVRMSVDKAYRRRGIGQAITEALLIIAREMQFKTVLVETNDNWHGAIHLYKAAGFVEVERKYSERYGFTEIHMLINLE